MTSRELNTAVADVRLGSFPYPARVDVLDCGPVPRAVFRAVLVVAMRPEGDPSGQAAPGDNIEVSRCSEPFDYSHATAEEVRAQVFAALAMVLLHELQEQFRDRAGRLLFDPHGPAGDRFRVQLDVTLLPEVTSPSGARGDRGEDEPRKLPG